MGGDDEHYVPSIGALEFVERVERLEAAFKPLPPRFYNNISEKKKPKKKRQMKLKAAFKNQTKPPENFQGAPVDKCITVPELGNKEVFVHPNYTKAWNRRKKESSFEMLPEDDHFCSECYLQPCSARLLHSKIQVDSCTLTELTEMNEDEHITKMQRYYRAQLCKLQGKKFVNRNMPTNAHVPLCVKTMTSEIASVHITGNESSSGTEDVGCVFHDDSSDDETWDIKVSAL